MQYILYCSLLLLILCLYWFFGKSRRSNKIHNEYQIILDHKLLPLGFEKKEMVVGGREQIAFYKRETLEITLSYEIAFDANHMYARSGRKVNLQSQIDQLPSEIKNKITNLQELDGNKLVPGTDLSLELSNSEDMKSNFIQTLDKWLAENQ